jgi:hypothetical protein
LHGDFRKSPCNFPCRATSHAGRRNGRSGTEIFLSPANGGPTSYRFFFPAAEREIEKISSRASMCSSFLIPAPAFLLSDWSWALPHMAPVLLRGRRGAAGQCPFGRLWQ